MLSFVRRLNPFRKYSDVTSPLNITTRSVQTELNGSHNYQTLETQDADVSRKGINRLLQEFQRENFNVATLMDQEGRIFFTIDLTEIVFKDIELENIVKIVQKSIRDPSKRTLLNKNSDEITKKLKRHFLFESMKNLTGEHKNKFSVMLSESYHTAERGQGPSGKIMKTIVNARPCEPKKCNISSDEKELKSLLYEAKSCMSPEESAELLDSLRSSLATKIFKKIEQTIDSFKRKHKMNQEIGSNANVSIVFSRHCNPVQDPKERKISHHNAQSPDPHKCKRREPLRENLKCRKASSPRKLKSKMLKMKKPPESIVSKNSDSTIENLPENKRKVHEKDCVVVRAEMPHTTGPTPMYSEQGPTCIKVESVKKATKERDRGEVKAPKSIDKEDPVPKKNERTKEKVSHQSTSYKEHRKLKKFDDKYRKQTHKRHVKKSKDEIKVSREDTKRHPDTKHIVDRKEPRKTNHEHKQKGKDKHKRDETRKLRLRKMTSSHKPEDKHHKTKTRDVKSKFRKIKEDEKATNVGSGIENVVVLFNGNQQEAKKADKSKQKRSVKPEVKREPRTIRERCAFTSSDNSQVHRGYGENSLDLVDMTPTAGQETGAGSSEKLIAVISFGPSKKS